MPTDDGEVDVGVAGGGEEEVHPTAIEAAVACLHVLDHCHKMEKK